MLKFWDIKDTHHLHHLPAPIKKSVSGEITNLPTVSAVPPLLLTGPESPTDSETKRKHSSGPSRCSPPSQLNRGNSPSSQPYNYADAYSEQIELIMSPSNSPSISSLSLLNMEADIEADMEVPESRKRIIDGRPRRPTGLGERSEKQSVVVVVDATEELQLAGLQYALDNYVYNKGDTLWLLGILHQVLNPMGYKQKAASSLFNGTSQPVISAEINKKTLEFRTHVHDPELEKLYQLKEVVPEVLVCAGPSRKMATVKHAEELRANIVILDKNLKKDKAYIINHLHSCTIVLMDKKGGMCIKTPIGDGDEERHNTPQGGFQLRLDGSLENFDPSAAPSRQTGDLSPRGFSDSAGKRLSKAFNPIRESTFQCDSSTSPEQHRRIPIVYNRQALSTMTESEKSSSPHHGEDEIEVELEDPGPSRSMVDALDHQREYELMVEQLKGGTSEGEDVDTMPEHDLASLLSSSEMVRSADSPSADSVAYKIQGRPMSTGDLQSLMAKHSAATVFRPAPRSVGSDRAGDELMNILNAPKSPPEETSETRPRSGASKTLENSLREDDLESQTPTMMQIGNGPIGRQSKFGNENEEKRILENPKANSRKKNPRPAVPLCSKCNHPGPVLGENAVKFTYAQLEKATKNFDQENYLAEGGYGFVYKGELENGQKIAVKQYKAASSQGDDEFYSEVDVLRQAIHRNLVILIGFCTEEQKRLLVYEFVCNKSLDVHLSAKNPNVLEWKSRWKIAVGAARGLRYLHEECRVGCIVHRDMRPNNILLTHDFVPMVGDFGLARSQPSGDNPEETRVIGTLGYLAPEYAESGSITEKADVYSFGVVLLELITGRKAIDATRLRGETCLTEWARPLISQGGKTDEEILNSIVDPRLKKVYDIDQVNKMVDAAARCISKDPFQRPRMSDVLRILEQDTTGLMSRNSSMSDLSVDISRNPPQRESRRGLLSNRSIPLIPRLASLDSVHAAKAAPKVTGAGTGDLSSSLPGGLPLNRVKAPRESLGSERASSPHLSRKSSVISPASRSSLNSPQSKPKTKNQMKLFYNDMV